MPSSDTNSVPTQSAILFAYAEETRPLQILLFIYSVLGAICFPLLLALFHFSTARTRRTPLFIIVMIDVVLGIAVASWIVSIALPGLLNPLAAPSRSVLIAIPLVGESITWVVDLVLLLRLYAIFPVSTTSRRTFWGVLLLSVLLKAGRVGFCVTDFARWARSVPGSPFADQHSSNNSRLVHSPLLKLAIICDILDHAFVASCFLWKLRNQPALRKGSPKHSLANRIKGVFYIALGNFVFPIFINLVMLLFISIESLDFINALYLIPVNVYVNIFGVVFATVWSSSYEHAASLVTLDAQRPRAVSVATLSAYNAAGHFKQDYQ